MGIHKKNILVIDDDLTQRDLYVQLFSENGFEVISASDGLEGLEKALSLRPDVIFTGIIMPRMNGFEMIKNLRENVSTSAIPVIMFSHLGREEDRKKSQQLSLTDFMVKGFDSPAKILQKAKDLVDGQSGQKMKDPQDDRPGGFFA